MVESHAPLLVIKNGLLKHDFVVITGDFFYIIVKSEEGLLASEDDLVPAARWLKKMQWLPSAVFTMKELFRGESDWRRSILIENEEKEIVGIVTADRWIKYLHTENKKRKFHKDLYYHLTVIKIDIPPLRQRKEDIMELVQTFLKEFTTK